VERENGKIGMIYAPKKKMPVAPQQKPKSATIVVDPDLNGSGLVLVG
jgi:hypothetical protein